MDVYDAIHSRRDVRSFRPDPLPDDVLERILRAGHHAPSVGLSQPWRFLLVRSRETRQEVRRLFEEANARAAEQWSGERRALYDSLKLEGILDAPLNLCVLCDTRSREPVLGAHTLPETAKLSTGLAIQNMWLAARAEGVGLVWVSIFDPDALRRTLGLPAGVEIVGYLCVGYPERFLERPMLELVGWRSRLPLTDVVHEERFDAARTTHRASHGEGGG